MQLLGAVARAHAKSCPETGKSRSLLNLPPRVAVAQRNGPVVTLRHTWIG
jgi:hypothetical protein